ncbi:hypothetical protein JTB14_038453 [Gonioctena quinquepunctata]|nr:hypothetical protein JTB14_038453 [Gonioctena quinquepunctata]
MQKISSSLTSGVEKSGLTFSDFRRRFKSPYRLPPTLTCFRYPTPETASFQKPVTWLVQEASRQPTGQEEFASAAGRADVLRS